MSVDDMKTYLKMGKRFLKENEFIQFLEAVEGLTEQGVDIESLGLKEIKRRLEIRKLEQRKKLLKKKLKFSKEKNF